MEQWKKQIYEEELQKAKSKHLFKKHMRGDARTRARAKIAAALKHGKTTTVIRGLKETGRGLKSAGKAAGKIAKQSAVEYQKYQRTHKPTTTHKKKHKKKHKQRQQYVIIGGIAHPIAHMRGAADRTKKRAKKQTKKTIAKVRTKDPWDLELSDYGL